MTDQENTAVQPQLSEYKGKPVLRIPLVDAPDPNVAWHYMSFGKNKAKAIVKWIEAIRKFASEEQGGMKD